jgi:hypothetical protein
MLFNQPLKFVSSLFILLFIIGIASSIAQNNPNDSHKSKGDENDNKPKHKAKHLSDFDQSGLNIGLETAINGTFIIHQQTYGLSRLMPYSPSIKFAAGALFGYNFSEHAGIVLGFGYCGAGQNYHDYLDGETFTKSVSMNYIQVPLLFKYIFNTDETTQPYLMGGFQVGSLLNSTVVINDSTQSPSDLKQVKTTTTKFFQPYDMGFRIATGEDFQLDDNISFNAGIVIYYGLPDINNTALRHTFIFRSNTYAYKKSSNFISGIEVGIHYLFQ